MPMDGKFRSMPIYEELKPQFEYFEQLEKEIIDVQQSLAVGEEALYSVPVKPIPVGDSISPVSEYSVPTVNQHRHQRSTSSDSSSSDHNCATLSDSGSVCSRKNRIFGKSMVLIPQPYLHSGSVCPKNSEHCCISSEAPHSDYICPRGQHKVLTNISVGTVASRVDMFDASSRQNQESQLKSNTLGRRKNDPPVQNRLEGAAEVVRKHLESRHASSMNGHGLATIRRSQPLRNLYNDYNNCPREFDVGPEFKFYSNDELTISKNTSPPKTPSPPPIPTTLPLREVPTVELGRAVFAGYTKEPQRVAVTTVGAINRRLQQHRLKQQSNTSTTTVVPTTTTPSDDSFTSPRLVSSVEVDDGKDTRLHETYRRRNGTSCLYENCDHLLQANGHQRTAGDGASALLIDPSSKEEILKDMSQKIERLVHTIDRQTRRIDTMQMQLSQQSPSTPRSSLHEHHLMKSSTVPKDSTYRSFDITKSYDTFDIVDFDDCKNDGRLIKETPRVAEGKRWTRKIFSCIR